MKKQDIRRHVVRQSLEGRSRQAIYDELNATYKGRELDLATIVVEVPTLVQRTNWKRHQIALVALLVIVSIFNVVWWIAVPLDEETNYLIYRYIVPPVMGVMLWGVATWRPYLFYTTGAAGVLLAEEMLRGCSRFGFDPWAIVNAAIAGGIAYLGGILGSKLVNKYRAKTEQYKTANGQIRLRATVWFDE